MNKESNIFVGTVVVEDGKVLMIKEGKNDYGQRGTWNFPAGHVECGEGLAEAAVRETLEESGYKVELDGVVAVQKKDVQDAMCLIVFFSGTRIDENQVQPEDGTDKVEFIPIEKLHDLNIRFPELIDVAKRVASGGVVSLDILAFEDNLNKEGAAGEPKHGSERPCSTKLSDGDKSRKWTIEEMKLEDVEPATEMRLKSWLDTYINDDFGVARDWIEQRNAFQRSDEKVSSRRDRFLKNKANGTMSAWVVRDESGVIIGSTTPYVDGGGVQHVGSLYVDKEWHGKGVSGELMTRVLDWFDLSRDIVLNVVAYNERAKAFYRKWGFEEVPDSDDMFEGVMPEIMMIRKGGKS